MRTGQRRDCMDRYSAQETASLLGLNVSAVYILVAQRRIAHRRVGVLKGQGRIQISQKAIDDFVESCESPPSEWSKLSKNKFRRRPGQIIRPDGQPLKYF